MTDHCKAIFGEDYQRDQRIPESYLKEFQENSLSLQAVTEVDRTGRTVRICEHHVQLCPHDGTCSNKVSRLVRTQRFEYETLGNQRCFNPSKIYFRKLELVSSPVLMRSGDNSDQSAALLQELHNS